eukprot:GHVU01055683.1.p1 GENE.GHVU01055683.1~~GHVU01055683.1.p1  ORF type:complete len:127 (+),score=12.69 GHVU01055683.1:638-1018(+)
MGCGKTAYRRPGRIPVNRFRLLLWLSLPSCPRPDDRSLRPDVRRQQLGGARVLKVTAAAAGIMVGENVSGKHETAHTQLQQFISRALILFALPSSSHSSSSTSCSSPHASPPIPSFIASLPASMDA